MGSLDESKQTSKDPESEKATTNDVINEQIVNPSIGHDESTQFGSNKNLISFSSNSSSVLSDFSLEDVEVDDHDVLGSEHDHSRLQLETEHDEKQNEESSDSGTSNLSSSPSSNDCVSEIPPIQVMERPKTSKYRIPSHVFTRKKSTTPGDWSMASTESLFSIHMGGHTFCHHDSYIFSPEFNLPNDDQFVDGTSLEMDEENSQGPSMLNEPMSSEDKENQLSGGETEKGSPAMEVPEEQNPEPSDDKAEPPKATPLIVWTKWFPCFRYCACCS